MIKRYLQSPPQVILIAIAVTVGLLLGVSSAWSPALWALGAFLGVWFLLNVFRRPEIFVLIYLFMTSSIVQQTKVQSVSIGIGTVYLTDVLLMLSFGLIIVRRLVEPEFKLVRTPLDWPLITFLGASYISTFIAIVYGESLTLNDSLGEIRVVTSYLLFFVITNLVRDKKQLILLIKGFLLIAMIVATAMIIQYLLGQSIKILPGRLESVSSTSQGVRIIPPGQSVLLVAFLVVFSFFVMEKIKIFDVFRLIQSGLLGLGIVMTYFRASWIMTITNVLLIGFLSRYKERQRHLLWVFIILLSASMTLLFVMQDNSSRGAKFAQSAFDRFSLVADPSSFLTDSSLRWRGFEYGYAFPQIFSNPIGLGLGARYRPFTPPFDWEGYDGRRFIHNGYLWVLMKSGWFAFPGLLWFLFGILIRGLKRWRSVSDPYLRAVVLAFALSSLSVLVITNVEPYVVTSFWTPVIAIIAAVNEVIFSRFSQVNSKDRAE